MNQYVPLLILLVLSIVLALTLTAISYFFGPLRRTKNAVKADPYECGVPAIGTSRDKMSVKFYLTAILFILFDIETVFLYLWARVFRALGWFGLVEVMVFIAILVAGYIYVVRRGALEWET